MYCKGCIGTGETYDPINDDIINCLDCEGTGELMNTNSFEEALKHLKNDLGEELIVGCFDYLEELRESGRVNMWGCRAYLINEYDNTLTTAMADSIITMWKRYKTEGGGP